MFIFISIAKETFLFSGVTNSNMKSFVFISLLGSPDVPGQALQDLLHLFGATLNLLSTLQKGSELWTPVSIIGLN